MTQTLLIFGLGYSGRAIAQAAAAAGFTVIATSRNPEGQGAPPGVTIIPFDAAAPAIASATHIIATSAPDEHGVRPVESVPVFVFILAVTRKNASLDAQDDGFGGGYLFSLAVSRNVIVPQKRRARI